MHRPTTKNDDVPSTRDRAPMQSLEGHQTLIPEYVYTTTKLPMFTPDNALDLVRLLRHHTNAATQLLRTLFSGSSTLTLQAYVR